MIVDCTQWNGVCRRYRLVTWACFPVVTAITSANVVATLRIRHRIAEHVEEGGAEELFGELEGLLAFPPQGVRLVQNPRDPLLLRQGREGDVEVRRIRPRCVDARSRGQSLEQLRRCTNAWQGTPGRWRPDRVTHILVHRADRQMRIDAPRRAVLLRDARSGHHSRAVPACNSTSTRNGRIVSVGNRDPCRVTDCP